MNISPRKIRLPELLIRIPELLIRIPVSVYELLLLLYSLLITSVKTVSSACVGKNVNY